MLQFEFQRKCQLDQHKQSNTHKTKSQPQPGTNVSTQPLLREVTTDSPETKEFAKDLTLAFLKEGIPLYKMEQGPLRDLFNKYSSVKVPSVSTMRRMVPKLAEENLSEIREDIGESKIWISVDEATDPLGRNVANVVVGKLTGDEPGKGHLIYVTDLEKTNASAIVQTIQEALRILWLGAPNTGERLLLLVTDSVAYMLSAGKTLKDLYPKLIHATCFAHGLHRVAETVREEHPIVNKLISVGKKLFLKAPRRVEIFKRIMPDTPLPPEPVITRWGTWLSAASYYFHHLEKFKKVVELLEDDAQAVATAKEVIKNPLLTSQLIYLQSNFKDLPKIIEDLQSQEIPLAVAVEKVDKIRNTQYPGTVGKKIQEKVKAVLKRNCGWEDLNQIANILKGEEAEMREDWTVQDVMAMKFAPSTSADVERTFSKMKYLLSDRRLSFKMNGLSDSLILFFNKT